MKQKQSKNKKKEGQKMNKQGLDLLSLNVRGIRDKRKRSLLFQFLIRQN